MKSNLPEEIVHADDWHLITELNQKKERIYQKAKTISTNKNLLVHEDKTENTAMKRKDIEAEDEWRNVIKLESKRGDRKDIKRTKELPNIALSSNETVWKNKWKTKLKTRLRLYESLVKSILLYNWGTWELLRSDQKKLDSSYGKQLRRVTGIKWSHRITNNKLYHVTETEPLSITITERRWKLLEHILRLTADFPPRKAIRYYFVERTSKKFVGRKRTAIITKINEDIIRRKESHTDFPITPLISLISLQNINAKAKNRKLWQKVVIQVADWTYSL